MKKLHIFLLKSFIGPFIATFFVALFVLLMQFLWRYIDELVGKGLPFSVIAQILGYTSASMVPMALPLAVLLSSLMTFGNLAEHNELIAMKSSGFSLFKIMRPLMWFALFTTGSAFLFSNYVLPVANLKARSLLYDVKKQPAEVMIPEGVFYNGIKGYSIKVGKKDKESNMMYNLLIHDHTDNRGNIMVTHADSGTLMFNDNRDFLILTLFNGASYEDMKETRRSKANSYPMQRSIFQRQQVVFDLSGLNMERSDENLWKNHYQMLSIDQLNYTIDSLEQQYEERRLEFRNKMLSGNYFKKLNAQNDSLFAVNYEEYGERSPDTLFSEMGSRLKNLVLTSALSYARASQSQIHSAEITMSNKQKWLNKHKISWHQKFSLSFACLLLFFVGAPLGAIIRKGGMGLPTVISVLLFIMYYIISITGEKYGRTADSDLWFSMWFSSFIFLPIGIYLSIQASKDRVILNIDKYIDPIQKYIVRLIAFRRYRRMKKHQ
ncbi:MAG: LptF/LptG family permease [Salinivirgaceae bacterium]|nr:LptF/LptG family permease [Salinivirgaceae bacterium]